MIYKKPDSVKCPHCQAEIDARKEWCERGGMDTFFVVECKGCGEGVEIEAIPVPIFLVKK